MHKPGKLLPNPPKQRFVKEEVFSMQMLPIVWGMKAPPSSAANIPGRLVRRQSKIEILNVYASPQRKLSSS